MAFLHCHSCNWSQDDFWDKDGYSPLKEVLILFLKDNLFKDKIYVDPTFSQDNQDLIVHKDEKGHYVTGQEYVAHDLMKRARSINNMAVRTYDEWKKVKDTFTCPKCGSKNWDID